MPRLYVLIRSYLDSKNSILKQNNYVYGRSCLPLGAVVPSYEPEILINLSKKVNLTNSHL
jgi:hypothetical protein